MSYNQQIRVSDAVGFVVFGGLPDGALVRGLDVAIQNLTGDALFSVFGSSSRPRTASEAQNGDPLLRQGSGNVMTLDGDGTKVLIHSIRLHINKLVRPNWRFLTVVLDTQASNGDASAIFSLEVVPKAAQEFLS